MVCTVYVYLLAALCMCIAEVLQVVECNPDAEYHESVRRFVRETSDGKFGSLRHRYIATLRRSARMEDLHRTVEALRGIRERREGEGGGGGGLRAVAYFSEVARGLVLEGSKRMMEEVARLPQVQSIQEDMLAMGDTAEQLEPSFYLDRLDQETPVLNNSYFPNGDGRGIDVYLLDSGIHYTHEEFEGRARYGGFDAVDNIYGSSYEGLDCNGHGTHIAAVLAGKTYGVAKKATLYSIRVLDCQNAGAYSGIILALDYTLHRIKHYGRKALISMSLTGPLNAALNHVVETVVKQGVPCIVSAGNYLDDACYYSPPSANGVITVGASQYSFEKQLDEVFYPEHKTGSEGTCFGPCVDVFAPGKSITSASSECDNCTRTLSGTSIATPIVSGAVAIIMQNHPSFTVDEVKQRLINDSIRGVIDFMRLPPKSRTPNRLVYVPRFDSTALLELLNPQPSNNSTFSYTPTLLPPSEVQSLPPLNPVPPIVEYKVSESELRQMFNNLQARGYGATWLQVYRGGANTTYAVIFNKKGHTFRNIQGVFGVTAGDVKKQSKLYAKFGLHLRIIVPYKDNMSPDHLVKYSAIFDNDLELQDTKRRPRQSFEKFHNTMVELEEKNFALKLLNFQERRTPGLYTVSAIYTGLKENEQRRHYYGLSLDEAQGLITQNQNTGFYLSHFNLYKNSTNINYTLIFSTLMYGDGEYVVRMNLPEDGVRETIEYYSSLGYQITLIAAQNFDEETDYTAVWWR